MKRASGKVGICRATSFDVETKLSTVPSFQDGGIAFRIYASVWGVCRYADHHYCVREGVGFHSHDSRRLSLIILDSIEYHAEIIARFKLFQVLVISKSICNELPESSRGYLISFLKFVPQIQYNLFDLSPLITRI